MQTFSFKILLPDGKAFEDKIVSLLVRALDGEWGIRAGHAPAAAVLAEAVAVAEKEDGSKLYFVHGAGTVAVGQGGETELFTLQIKTVRDEHEARHLLQELIHQNRRCEKGQDVITEKP